MKNKMPLIITFFLLVAAAFLSVAYFNLRINYKSAVQALSVCREVAQELNGFNGTTDREYDSASLISVAKKECFMGGEPKMYLWFLDHPFKRIKD